MDLFIFKGRALWTTQCDRCMFIKKNDLIQIAQWICPRYKLYNCRRPVVICAYLMSIIHNYCSLCVNENKFKVTKQFFVNSFIRVFIINNNKIYFLYILLGSKGELCASCIHWPPMCINLTYIYRYRQSPVLITIIYYYNYAHWFL